MKQDIQLISSSCPASTDVDSNDEGSQMKESESKGRKGGETQVIVFLLRKNLTDGMSMSDKRTHSENLAPPTSYT